MKITPTLFRYFMRTYLGHVVLLLIALLGIVYLFDTVELLRRAAKFEAVPTGLVLQMSFLKLPEVGQVLFPFVILFSAMYTIWHLTKRSELTIVRASGFSVWQFLAPIILVSILLGFAHMMVINPLSSIFLSKFETLERRYLSREDNQIALFREGLWLRQAYSHENDQGYVIIHAPTISQKGWILQKPVGLFFTQKDEFVRRIDARQAILKPGFWEFHDAVLHGELHEREEGSLYTLPTKLTPQDVEESFASPEAMSFWRLPAHIQTLENAGFNADRLRVQHQNLLSQPLMLAAMVLLAAMVSMQLPRMNSGLFLLGLGVFSGFAVFFFTSYVQALGAGGQIPVLLAAWSPSVISLLIGLSVLMRLEDG